MGGPGSGRKKGSGGKSKSTKFSMKSSKNKTGDYSRAKRVTNRINRMNQQYEDRKYLRTLGLD